MRNILLIVAVSFSIADASAERVEVVGMQGLGHTEYHLVSAGNIDQEYHVFIGLPDSYEAGGCAISKDEMVITRR